jgi:hypothetical protein
MMGHFDGVLGGWVGGCVCVCVYKRVGWVSHFLPPRILLFNSQGLRVSGVKGETLIMNLTCIGMTQKKLVVLLSWVELSWVEILCVVGVLILMSYEDKMCPLCSLFNVIEFWVNSLDLIDLNKDNWIHWFTQQPSLGPMNSTHIL